jgi:hypothetical protein
MLVNILAIHPTGYYVLNISTDRLYEEFKEIATNAELDSLMEV